MFVPVPPVLGFRHLQVVRDLVSVARAAEPPDLDAIAQAAARVGWSDDEASIALADLIAAGGRIETRTTLRLHPGLVVAASLPTDAPRPFVAASALLIADRLQNGLGPDDLDWHRDVFAAHHRMLPPVPRAAILRGFAALGGGGDEALCAILPSETREAVVARLVGGMPEGPSDRTWEDLGRRLLSWLRDGDVDPGLGPAIEPLLQRLTDPAPRPAAIRGAVRHLLETSPRFVLFPGRTFVATDREQTLLPLPDPV